MHGKSQVKPWFFEISLISVFSLYFNNLSLITFETHPPPLPKAMPPQAPRRAAPGPTAAAVALTVRAPQAPRRAAPGPTAAAVALTVRAPQAPRRAKL